MKLQSQAALARELGLSPAAVSKLKRRGMPTHSADAARAWRAAHLHPGRMRPDGGAVPQPAIERVAVLAELATLAAEAGAFDALAGELRAALRAVPADRRADVALTPELWHRLIGPRALHQFADAPQAEALSDEDAEFVGAVCYALACHEALVA